MADRDLRAAVHELAASPLLLVALDFDGTMAPLVDRPEDARAIPEARAAMLRLAGLPETRVALISGRSLDSLVHVADPPASVLLSGSHGVESRLDAEPRVTLDDGERQRLYALRAVLDGVADSVENAFVEVKPAGFALHTRLVAPEGAAEAQRRAREGTAAIDGLTVRSGSNVLEFSVRSTTKGDAVRMLRDFAGAASVLFAGDDVTDEDGFAVLGPGDLGLKCGAGPTAAEFSVADPAAVAAVLHELADAREQKYS